jgi:hypothetical protein
LTETFEMNRKTKRLSKAKPRRPGPRAIRAKQNASNAVRSRNDVASRNAGKPSKQRHSKTASRHSTKSAKRQRSKTARRRSTGTAKQHHGNSAMKYCAIEDLVYWCSYDNTVLLSLGSREFL